MKIKKLLKIIKTNFLILIALLVLLEAFCFLIRYKINYDDMKRFNLKMQRGMAKPFNYEEIKKHLRPVIKGKSNKRPLLYMGCSFTYGSGLKEEGTLPYKISLMTGRTSYNRGIQAGSVQHILYQLRRDDFYKEVPDAEYIIYTFIFDHYRRQYQYYFTEFLPELELRYKNNNGKLEEVKPLFLPIYNLNSVRLIQNFIVNNKAEAREQCFALFLETLKESKRLAETHYKNVKFVILEYRQSGGEQFTDQERNTLIKAGFIVINLEYLVGHSLINNTKYFAKDERHPSAEVWEEVAPKLVKKLQLQ